MNTPHPANIQEFLTFLPARPRLDLDTTLRPTSTEVYTAQDVAPAEDHPIYCLPDITILPRLMEFLTGLVNSLDIGDVSCQSMQRDLEAMSDVSFQAKCDVSRYGGHVTLAITPVVRVIASASGIPGHYSVEHLYVVDGNWYQRGDYNVTVARKWVEDEEIQWESILVCSEKDEVYSVLLSKAEELSRPFSPDATKKQAGARAMAAKLALQMVAAKAEYGILFAGYIAIAAQLVRSADSSRPGRILLLSPVFKLQSESLPYYSCPLTQFQANIPTEPFLAILVAMLCANPLPGRSVWRPPTDLLLEVPDGDKEEDGSDKEECTDSDAGDEVDIPRLSLQVATNAMTLQHQFLRSRDINRISVDLSGQYRTFWSTPTIIHASMSFCSSRSVHQC
ncbi:hypothetical protein EV421DRAFT_1901297 [Armillaria borealis]|uniref:Uncharacterized protein n=1 Tax=Armillaria borealis TaxID=47425 RepID=A0AA39JTI2_9AGAR|nr:hypothetical protein EV421DRAFT_1901297 [Armillaria borealis]